jgi:hypothetical protein
MVVYRGQKLERGRALLPVLRRDRRAGRTLNDGEVSQTGSCRVSEPIHDLPCSGGNGRERQAILTHAKGDEHKSASREHAGVNQ